MRCLCMLEVVFLSKMWQETRSRGLGFLKKPQRSVAAPLRWKQQCEGRLVERCFPADTFPGCLGFPVFKAWCRSTGGSSCTPCPFPHPRREQPGSLPAVQVCCKLLF